MNEPFAILAAFLDRFGSDVEGRSLEALPPELQTQLQTLARGALDATERAQVIELLKSHPEWIAALAAEVKALRPPRAARN